MKIKHFTIICSECGSENVTIINVNSDWDNEDKKCLHCKDCDATEDL